MAYKNRCTCTFQAAATSSQLMLSVRLVLQNEHDKTTEFSLAVFSASPHQKKPYISTTRALGCVSDISWFVLEKSSMSAVCEIVRPACLAQNHYVTFKVSASRSQSIFLPHPDALSLRPTCLNASSPCHVIGRSAVCDNKQLKWRVSAAPR